MARPRSFDADDALDRAMHVFWEHGYEGTSVEDLLAALGIGLSSFYRTFASKQALYLAAIDRYRKQMGADLLAALQAEPFADAVGAVLHAVADQASRDEVSRGCLLVNATVERAPHDTEVQARIEDQFAFNRRAFCDAVARAQGRGEVPADRDPDALALLLVNTYHGLRVTGKAHKDRAALGAIVDATLAALG